MRLRLGGEVGALCSSFRLVRRLGRGALCLCFVVCVWCGQRCIDFFGEGAIKAFSAFHTIIWIPVDPSGAMIEIVGDDACLTTQRPQIFPLTPTSSASLAMLTHHTFSPEPQRCPSSFSSRGPPTVHLIPFRFSPSTTHNTANVPPHPIQSTSHGGATTSKPGHYLHVYNKTTAFVHAHLIEQRPQQQQHVGAAAAPAWPRAYAPLLGLPVCHLHCRGRWPTPERQHGRFFV